MKDVMQTCWKCHGSGRITDVGTSIAIFHIPVGMTQVCPTCHGSGKVK